MATLKDVRQGFQSTLEAGLTGVAVYRRVPGSLLPGAPCIVIIPATTDYLITYGRGGDIWEFDIHILAPSADDDVAQDVLDDFVAPTGDRSIATIIHANQTLGLDGVQAVVQRMTSYGFRFESISVPHVGATLRSQVLISH